MNAASLELCRELYELSGWDNTESYWTPDRDWQDKRQYVAMSIHYSPPLEKTAPAYDLGYLLRKLPYMLEQNGRKFLQISMGSVSAVARYGAADNAALGVTKRADTPENALCKLAVELLNQGAIKK